MNSSRDIIVCILIKGGAVNLDTLTFKKVEHFKSRLGLMWGLGIYSIFVLIQGGDFHSRLG